MQRGNNREINIAWKTVIHLDAICAALFQHVHRPAPFNSRAGHNRRAVSGWLRTIYNGAREDNARPHQFPGSNFPLAIVMNFLNHRPYFARRSRRCQ